MAEPKDVPPAIEEKKTIEAALNNPIACEPLERVAQKKNKVVIMVDDWTRPTRAEKVLLPTLKRLNEAGIDDSGITVVVAKGTRDRNMTKEELEIKIGKEAMERLNVINHDCDKDLAFLGYSTFGTPIWVNKVVFTADLKIGMGRIVPHELAGFSGGAKIILPGVSGRKTIGGNHSLVMRIAETTKLSGNVDKNPIRKEMEEAASRAGLDMIIDQITNRKNYVVDIVAGDFVKAHRRGVKLAYDIFSVKIPELVDVVIMSPEERGKSVEEIASVMLPLSFLKENGIIIMVSPCDEGVGSNEFASLCELGDIELCKKKVRENGWGSAGIAYLYLTGIKKYNPILVSKLKDRDVNKLGITATGSVEEALEVAKDILGGYKTVAVIPYGASTLAQVGD